MKTQEMKHEDQMLSIDAYFAGDTAAFDDAELRAHLAACDACRAYFALKRELAELDPAAPSAKARIASTLGLSARALREKPPLSQRLFRALPLPALGVAAAAAAVLFIAIKPDLDDERAFTARGGEVERAAELFVFHLEQERLVEVEGAIEARGELVIGYTNPAAKPRLLVFAQDARGQVFWLHPAWTDAVRDPLAIAIEATHGRALLEEAVRHPFEPGPVTLTAVFLDAPLSVREAEAILASPARHFPEGAQVIERALRVR